MGKQRILILFAHPALHKSRIHSRLIHAADRLEGVTFHDLYEVYPAFHINVEKEQNLLREHDIIIFQHPLYWYSTPAIIKEWKDLVLEYGFAYGHNGVALKGKTMLNVLSSGGPEESYLPLGDQRFTIRQFLAPFEQTASLCGMSYLPPFVVHGTHKLTPQQIEEYVQEYRQVLIGLQDGTLNRAAAGQYLRLNAELKTLLMPVPCNPLNEPVRI
jgi:glutathione-regulated potassium-efflux system ancillary protein KefG